MGYHSRAESGLLYTASAAGWLRAAIGTVPYLQIFIDAEC